MNLSNYAAARNLFLSEFETIEPLSIVGEDLTYDCTLLLKDIKSLVSYASAVLTREPILTETIALTKLNARPADESMDFETFLNITKLNNAYTFIFQATTFTNKEPLVFFDDSLLGQKNTYKPFDSYNAKTIDTMITTDLAGIQLFSDENFKFKNFRGLASFKRVDRLKKGHTVYFTDRDLYMTIVSARYEEINAYTALIYTGE